MKHHGKAKFILEYVGADKRVHCLPFEKKKNAETFALRCGLLLFKIGGLTTMQQRRQVPVCELCGTSEHVVCAGPDSVGSSFWCEKCKQGWTQEM